MTINRKRSVSPNTESSFAKNNFDDTKKSTLSSYFTKFKQSFLSPSPTRERINNESQQQQQEEEGALNDFNIEDDSLTNFKPSDKRRRLSIQGHPSPQEIPRSSVAYSAQFLPRQRSYSIMYNGVKTNEEELNNDLEVRVTAKESQDSIDDRDESPFVGLPPAPHSDIILGGGGNEINDDDYEQEDQAQFQEVIEYAPLYQDESGNIVRPPFINLDPRERYQLLQLKRSIETSEALKNRIKYMVNPNETHSRKIRGTNKVETSTQTHDIDYLNSTLNFKRKLEPLNCIHDRPVKKQKRRGFSMEPFEYDIKTIEPIVSTTSLTGILGDVSKPKFKDSATIEDKKITHIIPREDEEPILKKFAQKSASGNRNLFGRQDTGNLKLDDNYIKQSDSISDIIKLKDNLDDTKTTKKNTVGPSSGFKFNINKDDIREVMDARKENDKMFNSSKAVNNVLFGQKSDDKNGKEQLVGKDSKPSFSFGEPKKLEQSSLFNKVDSDKKKAPKFSFGGQSAQTKEAPKFTFGKTTTPEEPKESGDSGKEKLEESKKPSSLFSFGKTEEKKPTVDSAKVGLFGNKKESEPSKPLFSFGAKKDTENAPVFSFGGKKESTPASLDDNDDTPSLSIGKEEEEKPKQNETKPLFGFGGATTSKDSTPSTPNTTSSTPFTFGGPQKDEKKEESVKSGLFSFNQNSAGSGTSVASTFKFGGSTEDKPQKRQHDDHDEEVEKKDKGEEQQSITKKVNFNTPASTTPTTATTPQPISFSFGSATSNSQSKPAFQLGANITESKASTPGASSVATSTPVPPTTSTSVPSAGAFSFGGASTTKPTPPPTTGNPSFKFAAGITPPTATKPSFNFGATTVPKPTSTPAPASTLAPVAGAGAGAGAGAIPATSSTPNFSGLAQTSAFGGASSTPAFGQSNTTGGAFGNSAPASVFGQPSANTFGQTSNMFGNKSAVSIASAPTNNAFGSRPTTPTFNFGATTNPAINSNPVLPAPLPNAAPSFNFTGSKESTPDPASIFGQHNANRSASGTPFGGSMNNNMFGQQQQQQQQPNMFGAGTNSANGSFGFGGGANNGGPVVNGGVPTPVVNPRRIIQPRSRRR